MAEVLTYAYIRGKWYSFPDQSSANEAAIKYNGNIESLRTSRPTGVLVDDSTFINRPRSYWPDTLVDAPGVTGDALINPPVNPIQGPTVVTPTVTPTVTATAAQVPSAPSGGGEQGTDYYGGPKRTTGDEFLHGTNIKQSEVNRNLRANSGDAVYWNERLKNTDDPNDVLFEMAFRMGAPKYSASGDITGQGNPFVGKLQATQYKMTQGPTWAEQAVKTPQSGETDVYQVRDDAGKVTGSTEGKEWAAQFKAAANWKPGDFATGRARSDARIWREKHMSAAGEDAAQKKRVQKRFASMVGG